MVKEIIDEYKEGIYKSFDEAQRFLFHELEQELIEKTYLGIHKDMSKEEITEQGFYLVSETLSGGDVVWWVEQFGDRVTSKLRIDVDILNRKVKIIREP